MKRKAAIEAGIGHLNREHRNHQKNKGMSMNGNSKLLCWSFVVLITFLITENGVSEELKGKVVKTNGKQVEIVLEGDLLPQIGDPVVVGFIMPSLGFVALEGAWKISEVSLGENNSKS